jgi:hypothetical protein
LIYNQVTIQDPKPEHDVPYQLTPSTEEFMQKPAAVPVTTTEVEL